MEISRWLRGGDDSGPPPAERLTDEQAIERYRYMLRTAPPETIEGDFDDDMDGDDFDVDV